MWTQCSACPKCGAPIYTPTDWKTLVPPKPTFTCHCTVRQSPNASAKEKA